MKPLTVFVLALVLSSCAKWIPPASMSPQEAEDARQECERRAEAAARHPNLWTLEPPAYTAALARNRCLDEKGFYDLSEGGGVGIHCQEEGLGKELIVTKVAPGSPAEEAGVRTGDKVIAYRDRFVRSMRELNAVRRPAVGDTVELTVLRDGREITFRLVAVPFRSVLPGP